VYDGAYHLWNSIPKEIRDEPFLPFERKLLLTLTDTVANADIALPVNSLLLCIILYYILYNFCK
jgi:hypothetical protein